MCQRSIATLSRSLLPSVGLMLMLSKVHEPQKHFSFGDKKPLYIKRTEHTKIIHQTKSCQSFSESSRGQRVGGGSAEEYLHLGVGGLTLMHPLFSPLIMMSLFLFSLCVCRVLNKDLLVETSSLNSKACRNHLKQSVQEKEVKLISVITFPHNITSYFHRIRKEKFWPWSSNPLNPHTKSFSY